MLNIKLTNAMNMSNWHDWHGISKTTKTQWNDPTVMIALLLYAKYYSKCHSRIGKVD